MQRINTLTNATDLFGAGKHGYKPGNPATNDPATFMSADALNAIQEEIARVIEATGVALNPASFTQLLTAIQALSQSTGDGRFAKLAGLSAQLFSVAPATDINHAVALGQLTGSLAEPGYIKIPIWTGAVREFLIVQWGIVTISSGTPVVATFPVAFPSSLLNLTHANALVSSNSIGVSGVTLTGFTGSIYNTGSLALVPGTFRYLAIGK